MEQENPVSTADVNEVRGLVRQVIKEFMEVERERAEPAYKAELLEERRRREQLERRVNELIEENQRSRAKAEEAERQAAIRAELQRHGVTKLDLAFKSIKDDVKRTEDGHLIGLRPEGAVPLSEYVAQFVAENPEFLPARMVGGSGAPAAQRSAAPAPPSGVVEMEKIRPGMNREELERIRQEVVRVALQTLSGR